MIARFKSPTITRTIRVKRSLFILTSCERTCCERSSSYAEDSQTSTHANKRQNLHHAADPLRRGAQATENCREQEKHSFACSGGGSPTPSLTTNSAIYDGPEITLWGGLSHRLRIGSLQMLWCPRSF